MTYRSTSISQTIGKGTYLALGIRHLRELSRARNQCDIVGVEDDSMPMTILAGMQQKYWESV